MRAPLRGWTVLLILHVAKRMRDELGVAAVAPAHCTGHIGVRVFRHVFGERYVKAGLGTRTRFPASTPNE